MSLLISDLDFIEEKLEFISGAAALTLAPGVSTALSTSLDTKLLTLLDIRSSPDEINILQIALGSGAGAAAGAAAVKGRAIAISRATA